MGDLHAAHLESAPEPSLGIFRKTALHLKNRRNLPHLVSGIVAAALIWWLLAEVDMASALNVIVKASPLKIAMGFLCYGLTFYLRALRFQWLLPRESPVKHMFPIVLVHYTALNIIPARLGEFSYIYLLKKFYAIPTGYSLSSLFLARVFDQIAISAFFLLSIVFVDFSMPWLQTVSWIVGGVLIGLLMAVITLVLYKERCFMWMVKGIENLTLNRFVWIQKALAITEEAIHGFAEIDSKRDFVRILLISLTIWGCMFSFNTLLLTAFGLSLSYLEIILARTLIILMAIIPTQVFSNIGVRQTAWAFIVMALGVPSKDLAVVSSLSTRAVSTMFIALFGLYGVFVLKHIRDVEFVKKEMNPIESEESAT